MVKSERHFCSNTKQLKDLLQILRAFFLCVLLCSRYHGFSFLEALVVRVVPGKGILEILFLNEQISK